MARTKSTKIRTIIVQRINLNGSLEYPQARDLCVDDAEHNRFLRGHFHDALDRFIDRLDDCKLQVGDMLQFEKTSKFVSSCRMQAQTDKHNAKLESCAVTNCFSKWFCVEAPAIAGAVLPDGSPIQYSTAGGVRVAVRRERRAAIHTLFDTWLDCAEDHELSDGDKFKITVT